MILKRSLCRLFLGTVIAGNPFASAAQDGITPIKTSVCAISASPERFAGKIVAVSGELNSDGIERTVITDKNCAAYGIAITSPQHFKGEAQYASALNQGHPGTLDKKITGTFIGRFIWKPRERPMRILALKEVRDLSITANMK